ncbi:unnamed protein product [Mytilus coruscus]|uniref:Uncharacterized protein n=1 Tax=Mytilus coruscus TaxID=42192 RepID=A0A6J8A3B4_MYTCO|nr:unnamed protein product [Mytilus coruscus]
MVAMKEDDETIVVVDVEARTVVKVMVDELRMKFGLNLSDSVSPKLVPDNKSFIVFSGEKDYIPTHCLYDFKKGSLLKRVAGHRLRVHNQSYGDRSNYISMYYTPQSPFILTCESDRITTLRLWDKKSFLQLSSLTLDKKIVDIKLNSDGLSFVSYSEDPNIIVRWTIEGANVGKSSLSKYPAIFKGNG